MFRSIVNWFSARFGSDKFINRHPSVLEGCWIGGEIEPSLFKHRPDPLLMTPVERRSEMRRQIREDVR